jgi:hypothetical protein
MLFDKKTYFYFDESGSPSVLGHRGKNLLNIGNTSKNFMVGYIKTENPHELSVNLENLRLQLMEDEYLQSVPSVRNLKNGFHANKDCLEVREKVFKLLKKSDFEANVVVARKSVEFFRNKFGLNNKNLYKFLVSELLKNSASQCENIDIYFSVMGNIVNIQNMTEALDSAIREIGDDKKLNNIRLFLQKPSQIPLLQVADYILWSVFQVFEYKDFRYYNFLKEKFNSVHDIFDGKGNEGTFYNKTNPLEAKKLSPDSGLGF